MARDNFKDWNLLHKVTAAVVAALVVGIAIHAVRVRTAAFKFEASRDYNVSAETLWPWLVNYKDRIRWQAELIDMSRLMGDADKPGSTRLIFWQRGYKKWSAVERTEEVVQNRLYATYQEADGDHRWFRVELIPEGACKTRVVMHEVIKPLTYADRFWYFSEASDRQHRLDISLDALGYWMKKTAPTCKGETAGDAAG
ncbi:SRPBCC family protein [Kordiimonas marina]|uniref:SRPBCC family protein n=1 Tax=Kordiimonas marina TaxID=2872312 RepID=UPI001FF5BCA7|nr:SRPBCC family protein [Kordiimonas marina]MCJ9428448.1 SRPBCC family protein [Kordiimonas marina]